MGQPVIGKRHLQTVTKGNRVEVTATCECGTKMVVETDVHRFTQWLKGHHIQNVFPNLGADEREMFISGTCAKCWNRLFGE
jgi:hypothetical protein